MQRVRMGRVAGAVAAVCLVGGVANGDALAAIVDRSLQDAMSSEVSLANQQELRGDQIRVNLGLIGVFAVLELPYSGGSLPPQPHACRYDASAETKKCQLAASYASTRNAAGAMSIDWRSRTGAAQSQFDRATTDTAIVRSALVTTKGDSAASRVDTRAYRSTRQFSGTSSASEARILNGADTTFKTYDWHDRNRTVRQEHVVIYSNVTLPNNRSRQPFPTNGIVFYEFSGITTGDAPNAPLHFNYIVNFDGTRYPDLRLNGKSYTLDLITGIATLMKAD